MTLADVCVDLVRRTYGESYLIPERSYVEAVGVLARGLDIRTNWPVESIDHGAARVRLQGTQGRVLTADRVLVTASINVLKSGIIRFQPALPADKRAALSRLGMGNAVKARRLTESPCSREPLPCAPYLGAVPWASDESAPEEDRLCSVDSIALRFCPQVLLGFNDKFWPEKLYDVVCPGGFIPEFWMTTYPASNPKATARHNVTCFFAGERADEIGRMPQKEAVQKCLEELDRVFGTARDPKPASSRVVANVVFDWGQEKYVQGAYTYPTHGALLSPLACTVIARLIRWWIGHCRGRERRPGGARTAGDEPAVLRGRRYASGLQSVHPGGHGDGGQGDGTDRKQPSSARRQAVREAAK